ncbi:MAG: S-layer homology domain-containing protein, partial [Syntrophomonas sp.]
LFMRGAGYNFDKVSKKKANDKNPNTGTVKTPQVPWGQNYLDAAAQENLLPQEWLDNFNANAPANRAQIVVLICRLLQLPVSNNGVNNEGGTVFSDLDKTSPDYIPYITALSNAGIMKGYDDGTFRPQLSLKRCEAAALLSGLLEQNWLKVDAGRRVEGWVQSVAVQGSKSEIELLSLNGVQKIKLDPGARYFSESGECKAQEILNCRVEVLLNSKKQASCISLLERNSNTAANDNITGSVKAVVLGEDAVLVMNDLNSQEKKLAISSNAVLEDADKGKVKGFGSLKVGTFVKAFMADGKVVKLSILKTKTITGSIMGLTAKKLDLTGSNSKNSKSTSSSNNSESTQTEKRPKNVKPEWINHWDRARLVDKDGKHISSILRGDKVKITYLDPYPDEIDDEIPLEIAVTSRPAYKKAKGEVEKVESGKDEYLIIVKNKEYEVDNSAEVYLADGTKSTFDSIKSGDNVEMELDGAGVVMKITIQPVD